MSDSLKEKISAAIGFAFSLALVFALPGGLWLAFAFAWGAKHRATTVGIPFLAAMSFAAVVFGLGIAYWRLATGSAMLAVTGSVISLILFNFTLLYFDANASDWSLHRELNKRESFALAVNTLTTAGSSGITPNSVYARTLIAFQEVVDVAGFTVLLGLVIGASRLDRPGRQHS